MSEPVQDLDPNAVGLLALKAWQTREGLLVNVMLNQGAELGLFAAMQPGQATTAAELASSADCDERWILEWLRCMSAAGFIDSEDGLHFTMSPEASVVLADPSNPAFAGGAMSRPPTDDHIDSIGQAIRSGVGFSYGDLGADMARAVEANFAPTEKSLLINGLVASIDGLAAQLSHGAAVVDVGCGTGLTLELLANEFRASKFVGYDPSEPATEIARKRFAAVDNVEVVTKSGDEVPADPKFDVALTFDCLHDMTRPDLTLAAIRAALSDSGVLLVKEIRSSGDFATDRKIPVHAMMYAMSLTTCLASATCTEDGLGLGTLGLHQEALAELATEAGFSTIVKHDVGDPVNLFYEIRP